MTSISPLLHNRNKLIPYGVLSLVMLTGLPRDSCVTAFGARPTTMPRNLQAQATLARLIVEFARALIVQGKIVRTCLHSVHPFVCLCPFVFAPLWRCLAFIFRVAQAVPVNSIAKVFVSCNINLNGAHQHMPTIARVINPTIHHMRITQ